MGSTFVDFLLFGLWQREERFEALENIVLEFCRHPVTDYLEEAIVQTALPNVVYQFGFGILIVPVKDLHGCQQSRACRKSSRAHRRSPRWAVLGRWVPYLVQLIRVGQGSQYVDFDERILDLRSS